MHTTPHKSPKSLTPITKIRTHARSKAGILVAVAGFALAGSIFIVASRAATSIVATEPESGTLVSGAVAVADTTASGGSSIRFPVTSANPPTTPGTANHDYVQDFNTNVAAWPANGNGPSGYSGWCAYADGTSSKYYPSQVISVHDGYMDWNNHGAMAAAMLPFCYTGFTYGTYNVTMRVTADGTDKGGGYPGYHNAFLLWPNDGNGSWPQAGEFDYPESNTDATNPYMAVVQSNATFLPPTTTRTAKPWTDGQWHVYTMQWAPGSVTCYQDGVKLATVTNNIPSWAMHPVLQNEFANSSETKPSTSISGHTQVTRVTYDKSYTVAPANFN